MTLPDTLTIPLQPPIEQAQLDEPIAETVPEALADSRDILAQQDLPAPELAHRPLRSGRFWRSVVALGLCAAALAACTSGSGEDNKADRPAASAGAEAYRPLGTLPEFSKTAENLLANNWGFTPGVTAKTGTLSVTRTGGATLTTSPEDEKTAKPTYQPNPTVTLYGPHVELKQKGSVGFAARLTNMQGASTVSFLSAPNRRFDERVEHQAGIDVTVNGDVVDMRVWDGGDQKPTDTEVKLDTPANGAADVAVGQIDRQLVVMVNGQKMPVQQAVLGNQVWFGLNAAKSFDVTALNAYAIGSNEVTVKDMSKDTFDGAKPAVNGLASIAAAHGHGDKQIGTAVDLAELMSNPQYTEFVLQNFNEIETETLAKFQALQPEQGNFQFAELDALVKFANEHNLEVHGHALVFGEAYPAWLHKALEGASPEQALSIMQTHIKTVVSRYNGENGHGLIKYWDVVNEPFDPDEWGELNKDTIWYKAIGKDYIEEAFKAARAANPKGQFGLNEWAIETDSDRRNAVLNLLKSMPRGTVDFVGLQAHFDEETLDDDDVMDGIYSGDLKKIFAQFAAIGVKVRISEASVSENGDPETQSDIYRMLIEACMQAPNCIGFNLWGATSNKAYFTSTSEYGLGDDAPTKQSAGNGKVVERPAMAGLRAGAAA